MSIKLRSNLDRYPANCFPQNLQHVPRVGERIEILTHYSMEFPYPNYLEVKTVTHSEYGVHVDLWYDKISQQRILNENKEL